MGKAKRSEDYLEKQGHDFLERDTAVEFLMFIFLALWDPQAERQLVQLYLREGRHLSAADISKTWQLTQKQSR